LRVAAGVLFPVFLVFFFFFFLFSFSSTFVSAMGSFFLANQLLLPTMQVKEDLVFAPAIQGQEVRLANFSTSELNLFVDYSFDLHMHWPESTLNLDGEKAVGIIMENRVGRLAGSICFFSISSYSFR
jgi:hypothetical protein